MPDYEFIGKSQLSRGFSFPLKRSVLDAFLDERQVDAITCVAYCGPSTGHRVFCADYRGPQVRGDGHSLTLWVNAVPSGIRKYVSQRIEQEMLADLVDWILLFRDESQLASQMDHRFEVYYAEVSESGECELEVRIDEPREQWRLPRYRGKLRH